ncbi:hypothetical protein SDC9_172449 [bioreactor metagenome]|uniref:Uncharacterized protein n=1 Tax=bioreactor metagenome TaxID=1076179 RepID=A0A645GG62_9ZZZZ
MVDAMAVSKVFSENDLFISSKQNTAPAIGALKAAVNPAPAPQVIKKRSSDLTLFVMRANPFPTILPSKTLGPSLPKLRPLPNANIQPANLQRSTFHHFNDN